MALQAQSANVLEIALASAFHHRNNMIGVPEGFSGASASPGAKSPSQKSFQPRGAAKTFQFPFCMQAVDSTSGANCAITLENLFAKIARIAPQAPFFHAPIRTEGHAALGNLEVAPAAEIATRGAFGKVLPVGPTSRHGSFGAHLASLGWSASSAHSKNTKNGTSSRWHASKLKARRVKRRLRPRFRFGILRNCT